MGSQLAAIGILAMGLQVGWQPSPDGGVEYIVQVEPELLEDLAPGDLVAQSDFPPELVSRVTSYRVTVGTEPPPRIDPPPLPETTEDQHAESPPGQSQAAPDQQSQEQPTPPFPAPSGASVPADTGQARMAADEAPSGGEPGTLPPTPDSQPLDSVPTSFTEGNGLASSERLQHTEDREDTEHSEPPTGSPSDASAPNGGSPSDKSANDTQKASSDRPWLALTLAVSGMVAAMAGMLYTGWLAWEYRRKYLALLRSMLDEDSAAQPAT